MVGVAVETEIGIAARAFDRLTDEQLELIAHEVAEMIKDQTNRRFADEKAAPDGTAWASWTEAYPATRKPNQSLLDRGVKEGLRMSIDNYTTGINAVVGTNLIHGTIHQFGSEDGTLPARSSACPPTTAPPSRTWSSAVWRICCNEPFRDPAGSAGQFARHHRRGGCERVFNENVVLTLANSDNLRGRLQPASLPTSPGHSDA